MPTALHYFPLSLSLSKKLALNLACASATAAVAQEHFVFFVTGDVTQVVSVGRLRSTNCYNDDAGMLLISRC